MFLFYASVLFVNFSVSLILVVFLMVDYILAIFLNNRLHKLITNSWHVLSQYLLVYSTVGLSIFVAISFLITAIELTYIANYPLIFFLSFTVIGLLPVIAMPFILKSAKHWPLSMVRTFKGPYTKEEIEKIKESLSLECGKVERAKWSNEFKLNCHGFRVRIIPLSNFKNYQIRVIIEDIDENNASMVKEVIEKIDKMLIK